MIDAEVPLAHFRYRCGKPRATNGREDGNVLPFVVSVFQHRNAAAPAAGSRRTCPGRGIGLISAGVPAPQPDPDYSEPQISEPHVSEPKRREPVFNVPRIVRSRTRRGSGARASGAHLPSDGRAGPRVSSGLCFYSSALRHRSRRQRLISRRLRRRYLDFFSATLSSTPT